MSLTERLYKALQAGFAVHLEPVSATSDKKQEDYHLAILDITMLEGKVVEPTDYETLTVFSEGVTVPKNVIHQGVDAQCQGELADFLMERLSLAHLNSLREAVGEDEAAPPDPPAPVAVEEEAEEVEDDEWDYEEEDE